MMIKSHNIEIQETEYHSAFLTFKYAHFIIHELVIFFLIKLIQHFSIMCIIYMC